MHARSVCFFALRPFASKILYDALITVRRKTMLNMHEILLLNQKMRKQIFNTNEDAHTPPLKHSYENVADRFPRAIVAYTCMYYT